MRYELLNSAERAAQFQQVESCASVILPLIIHKIRYKLCAMRVTPEATRAKTQLFHKFSEAFASVCHVVQSHMRQMLQVHCHAAEDAWTYIETSVPCIAEA